MPIIVRDTSYPLPNADGRTGPTGAEIDAVETHFGVDWYDLMATLPSDDDKDEDGKPKPPPVNRPGCTRNRAIFAIAWIAVHRMDPTVTLGALMTEYGRDEIRFVSDDKPARKAKATEVPTLAGDEAPEPAATS